MTERILRLLATQLSVYACARACMIMCVCVCVRAFDFVCPFGPTISMLSGGGHCRELKAHFNLASLAVAMGYSALFL